MAWSIFTQGGGSGAALTWAEDLLNELGAPVTAGNKQFIYDWEVSEGGGGQYNPLNQGPVPGQPQLTSTGPQYGGGAADFVSYQAGLQGAAAYLNMPAYSGILSALRTNNPTAARAALIASPWAASHYGGGSAFSSAAIPGQASALAGGSGIGGAAGTTGSGSSGGTDVWSWIQDAVKGVADVATGPFDIGQSIASLATPFVTIAEKIDWLFHPSHWIRIIAFGGGAAFLGFGIWAGTHVGEGPPVVSSISYQGMTAPLPKANLPMAMLSIGIGGVLLFIAFHNVPDDVQNFQQFIGWLLSNVKQSATAAASGTGSGSPGTTYQNLVAPTGGNPIQFTGGTAAGGHGR